MALMLLGGIACGARQAPEDQLESALSRCAQGDADACFVAGRAEIFAAFANKDTAAETQLRKRMARACTLKQVNACAFLARVYRLGERKYERAAWLLAQQAEARLETLLTPYCRQGTNDACALLIDHFRITGRHDLRRYYEQGANGRRPRSPTTPPTRPVSTRYPKLLKRQPLVVPSDRNKLTLHRRGIRGLYAEVAVCIDAGGHVAHVHLIIASGLREYDRRVQADARRWRYRPYLVDGTASAICLPTGFIYKQSG